MATFETQRLRWSEPPSKRQGSDDDEALDPAECIRIPMANGVELMVSQDRPLPSPRQLVEIAFQIRKVFDRR